MRVLIVDDDFRRHVYLKRLLVGIASSVVSVYRAETAVRALSEGAFDLVFLDFDLEQQVGDAEEWWDDFMENNGLVVARYLASGAVWHLPLRVVIHSLNAAGAEAMQEEVGRLSGVVCSREPWCWGEGYAGGLWSELEVSV